MAASLLIRLRPTGPWRIGPDSGARDRVDRVFHSDALYAAVCSAMARLGDGASGPVSLPVSLLDAWLDATARSADPAVRLGSLLPYQRKTLFVPPPLHIWPPQTSARLRAKGASFVPTTVVADLLEGKRMDETRWKVDAESECLLPVGAADEVAGPFRAALRTAAAVDRGGLGVAPHATACLEFNRGAGLWCAVQFSDDAARETWRPRVMAAFRLLADSGFGGERSRGWGRSMTPEFRDGELAQLLFPNRDFPAGAEGGSGHWLLSLYHPLESDAVDWDKGSYEVVTRGGRVESDAAMEAGKWGSAKKPTRMVSEGSVLVAAQAPVGAAPDTAPEGVPHPVYRAGFAVTVEVPLVVKSRIQEPETPKETVDRSPETEAAKQEPEQQTLNLRPSPQVEIELAALKAMGIEDADRGAGNAEQAEPAEPATEAASPTADESAVQTGAPADESPSSEGTESFDSKEAAPEPGAAPGQGLDEDADQDKERDQ